MEEFREELKKQQSESAREIQKVRAQLSSVSVENADYKEQLADYKKQLEAVCVEMGKLKDSQAEEIDKARKQAVDEYARGYRSANRADFDASYQLALLQLMTQAQLKRRGVTDFVLNISDHLGYTLEPPPYVPPPLGTFVDDDDKTTLEAWDVHSYNHGNGVAPGKSSLLPNPYAIFHSAPPKVTSSSRPADSGPPSTPRG